MASIPVGILGATGMVGQQFIALLADHPWFKVDWLGASERSAGKAFSDAAAWRLPNRLPDDVANRVVEAAAPGTAPKLVFSGLDSSVAGEIEAAFAKAGHIVVSNSRNYRMFDTVPLLIPEVNADHLKLLDAQGAAQGWKGRIITNPNCATIVLAMALAPLRQFGLEVDDRHDAAGDFRRRLSRRARRGTFSATSFRTSAAAKKRRSRPRRRRFSARSASGKVDNHPVRVSATTTRVPVQNGHTGSISVGLDAEAAGRSDHRRLAIVPRPAAGAGPAVGAAAADRLPRRGEPAAAAPRRRTATAA